MTPDAEAIARALLAQGAYTIPQADTLATQFAELRRKTRVGMQEALDWIFDTAEHPVSYFDAHEFLTGRAIEPPPQPPARKPEQQGLFGQRSNAR